MNNPNFRLLEDFDSSLSDESNDGAQKKTKKKRLGADATAWADKDAVRHDHLLVTERPFWRRVVGEESLPKAEPKEEVVIYSAKDNTPEETERTEADEEVVAEPSREELEAADKLEVTEVEEVIAAYVETRTTELQEEQASLPVQDSERPAIAADLAFLQTIRNGLRTPVTVSRVAEAEQHAVEAVGAAYRVVEQRVQEGGDPLGSPEEEALVPPVTSSESPLPGNLTFEDTESSQKMSLASYATSQAPAHGGVPPHRGGTVAATNMMRFPQGMGALASERHAARAREAAAEQPAATADWFVPAAVAYLLGRRHGRKKAERQLVPQQRKLETHVRALVTEVAAKEARIRQLARQQAELRKGVEDKSSQPPTPRAPVVGVEKRRVEATPPRLDTSAPNRLAAQPPSIHRIEATPQPPTAIKPEVTQARMAANTTYERFVVPPTGEVERTVGSPQIRPEVSAGHKTPPEVMNHEELLVAGAEISIGSVDLKSIYEDHKISEEGLRRLVVEHRHGGDIRNTLKDEMLKKELSYEQDPMRQYGQQTPEAVPATRQSQPILPSWLMQTPPVPSTAALPETAEPLTIPPYPKLRKSASIQTRRTVQPVLVVANATAFVILAILVVVLFIVWLRS